MAIQHHLSDPLLIAYAAGNLPEAFGLVVATHVSMCDDCRARLGALDALGGAVLEGAAVPMAEGSLDACLAGLGARQEMAPHDKPMHGLPAPLADYIGGGLSAVKWKPLGMGVQQAILRTGKGASARLLCIPAGQSVPDHGHRGLELTLVLQGAFHDDAARFAKGDLEIATAADTHTPVAEAGEACICLAATDARLRFSGLIPRLLQPLFRI